MEGKLPKVDTFFWKYHNREYIKADGVFQRVVAHKGNVYHVQTIGAKDVSYLITDGNGKWSHGDTLEEARRDLIYKLSNRDKSKYEDWTIETEVSMAEAIEAYRVITGACEAGTRHFVENILPAHARTREVLKIAEVIEFTRGQYQAEVFANFFKR